MTNREEIFDRDVMICSVNPAMDGLAGSGNDSCPRKEKNPEKEEEGSMYLLTAIPPPTCRSTTVIVNATFCHCLSRYQILPTVFPNASGSGRMRYTRTG